MADVSSAELGEWVQAALGAERAATPGAVLSSGLATIRPGRVYLMGLNPGGDPDIPGNNTPISKALSPPDGSSCYTDECWRCGPSDVCDHLVNGHLRPHAAKPHQERVTVLAQTLGFKTPADMPSANAVFARSKALTTLHASTGLNVWQWWDLCWPVHRQLLAVIQPEIIITLGHGLHSSALGLLANRAGVPASEIERIGDEGVSGGKRFKCDLTPMDSTLTVQVVGVPHPSYYAAGPVLQALLQQLVV